MGIIPEKLPIIDYALFPCSVDILLPQPLFCGIQLYLMDIAWNRIFSSHKIHLTEFTRIHFGNPSFGISLKTPFSQTNSGEEEFVFENRWKGSLESWKKWQEKNFLFKSLHPTFLLCIAFSLSKWPRTDATNMALRINEMRHEYINRPHTYFIYVFIPSVSISMKWLARFSYENDRTRATEVSEIENVIHEICERACSVNSITHRSLGCYNHWHRRYNNDNRIPCQRSVALEVAVNVKVADTRIIYHHCWYCGISFEWNIKNGY